MVEAKEAETEAAERAGETGAEVTAVEEGKVGAAGSEAGEVAAEASLEPKRRVTMTY